MSRTRTRLRPYIYIYIYIMNCQLTINCWKYQVGYLFMSTSDSLRGSADFALLLENALFFANELLRD